MLVAFDHVNVRTNNLDAMIAFYVDVLGFHLGPRPDFSFGGAWLYIGDQAMVHLVAVDGNPATSGDLALEHFAFRAEGMGDFLAKLTAADTKHSVDSVPGIDVVQVNFRDPDGNHIHVDFDASEHSA